MEPLAAQPTTTPARRRGRISASFALLRQSWKVLGLDKELVLFPIWSGIVAIIGGILFGLAGFLLFGFRDHQGWPLYLYLFVYYVFSYFVLVFFQSGLVACVLHRFDGGDPTFRYGLSRAWSRKGPILVYALIAATVGVILRAISERVGWLGDILIAIIGVAWSILTVFIAPVLVMTDLGPIESIRESGRVFRRTWGENVVGRFSLGFAVFLGMLVALAPFVLSLLITSRGITFLIGLTTTLILLLILATLSSALSGIFGAALYRYASTGEVPEAFDADLVTNSFQSKKLRSSL